MQALDLAGNPVSEEAATSSEEEGMPGLFAALESGGGFNSRLSSWERGHNTCAVLRSLP